LGSQPSLVDTLSHKLAKGFLLHSGNGEISIWLESTDMHQIRRGIGWSFFVQVRNVFVELIFVNPYNFKIMEKFRRYVRMARNILLDFAQHQAFAGIVWANEDRDSLCGELERFRKLREL
jgi:hypothetical protein